MSTQLVFITGATGHIGFKTLVDTLKAGYSVRAAIRSEAKKEQILSAKSIQALNPGSRLTFVIVPDLTVDRAYDEAVRGATYIIHLASPIVLKGVVHKDYQKELIDPAVTATTSILKAAIKTTGIKRIVITSSIAAIIPFKYLLETEAPEGTIFDHTSTTPFEAGPYASDFHAYNVSKVAALDATNAFIQDNSPSFDIVNIDPSLVIGKNELITSLADISLGTNIAALAPILGNKSDSPVFSGSVHVNDVAFLHVKALDPEIPAGTYIATSEGLPGTTWQNATRIVAETFPEAVKKGVFPNDGVQPTLRVHIDASFTEKVFGFKFASYEEQVKSIVGHYLELVGEKLE